MAKTVADFMLERLRDWGVERVYGYSGEGIGGILSAVERTDGDGLDFIQPRHEEEAAFMACAHAKYTGEVGVCMSTSGPGAIHLLNGLYDAKLDHQPVVAIVGQQPRPALGGDFLQEVDLPALFKDVAHEYVHMCASPEQMRHLLDRAFRIAKGYRTVTALIVPADVQEADAVEEPRHGHGTMHSGVGYTPGVVTPDQAQLERAAAVLNEGEKVAMFVGAGALGAGDEVMEIADILGAGVAKALLGRAAVGDDEPGVTGQSGLLGTKPSWELVRDCDTFFMIGSGFPYAQFLPKEGDARGVQIDIDPGMLSLRYPMEVNLQGDAGVTLRALKPLLKRKTDRKWRRKVEDNIDDWWKAAEKRAHQKADPVNPQLLFWELSPRLPDDVILSADSGTSTNWFARALKVRRGMKASLSGTLATMCPAVPYTTAAKFCYPDRPAIGFIGDGAMQMLGLNALITIARYWRQWDDPRAIICVLNNGDLNQVTWELRAQAKTPKVEDTQDVPAFDYAHYAGTLGLKGIRIEKPEDIAPAWDSALAADRPVVIDALVDPTVPTLPSHITRSQAKSYVKALMKGDPEARAIIWHSLERGLTR
jgi:pyruvate dehydrogenase (quinone)